MLALHRFRVCDQMRTQSVEREPTLRQGNLIASKGAGVRFAFHQPAGAASLGVANKSHGFPLAGSYHSRRPVHGMPFNASSVPVFGQ